MFITSYHNRELDGISNPLLQYELSKLHGIFNDRRKCSYEETTNSVNMESNAALKRFREEEGIRFIVWTIFGFSFQPFTSLELFFF